MPIINLSNYPTFQAVKISQDPGAVGGPKVIPNCVEVDLAWVLEDGKIGHNVLHARYGAGFTPTTTIANSILTALVSGANWTALASFLASSTQLAGINLRDLNQADQPLVSSTVAGAPGSSVSESLPNETAAVITLRTALAGRQNRGRAFIPGWAANALAVGNVMVAAAVTDLQAWATNNLTTAMNSNGLQWAIGQQARVAYTGSTGTQHPARNAGTVLITGAVVRDNHWDSQRRRGLK